MQNNTTPQKKSVEEVAGEIWRCIKHDFEKYGISLPESWKGAGLAYGGYSRAVNTITTLLAEREAELVQRVEQLWKHTGLTAQPLVNREDVLTIIKEVFKK